MISTFVNDVEVNAYGVTVAGAGEITTNQTTSTSIISGASAIINVYVNNYGALSSGTTVNVKLHSAGGMDYIRLVELV
jgi:hypothetical protein